MSDGAPKAEVPVDPQAVLLRTLADKVPAMIAYWGSDLRCRFANRDYEKWFGIKPEALIGMDAREFLGPLFELNRPYIEGALRGEEQEFEREIPDPAGGPPRHSQAHYIPDIVDGSVRGFCVLVTDITRRKSAEEALVRAERQLQTSERLAATAALAGGIGHEINNPLGSVLANVELITEYLEGPERDYTSIWASLEEIRHAARRIADIVQTMKVLGRVDSSKRDLVDVKGAIEQSIGLSMNVIRYRARLVQDLEEAGSIEGNAPQLAQVLVNLLANAAQALSEENAERNEIRVSLRREGSDVVIEVSDNGRGIPDDVRAHIFEPFFTTKDVGEGLGLGLSISSSIVRSFGGQISVESKVGQGSVFRVVLPAAEERSVREAPGPSSGELETTSGRHTRGRLLIIDDEVALTRTLRRALSANNDVVTVNRGRDALALLADVRQPDFDLILCDLMMPELSGADVFAEATRSRPELAQRFVFMTGGAFTPRGRQFLEGISAPVLDKPIELARLRALVLERTQGTRESAAKGSSRSGSSTSG